MVSLTLAQATGAVGYPDVLNNALNVVQTIALAYLAIKANQRGRGNGDG